MIHVKQIKKMVEEGEHIDAHKALDNLLELGPKNTEALKLRTVLFANEGRFLDERIIWEKIITHDNEDLDALFFFQRRHFEERESFYFTDRLPNGGVRFLANPRGLINSSIIGLFGCSLFLVVNSYSQKYYVLESPVVSMVCFLLFVVIPWLGIIVSYFRSLKEVVLSPEGIAFHARTAVCEKKWKDIDNAYIIYGKDEGEQKLALVLTPKNKSESACEIDLSPDSTSIRARVYFLEEVCRFFKPPVHLRSDLLVGRFPLRRRF